MVVEKHVAPYMQGVNNDYLADPRSKHYPIRKGDTGAYVCRKTVSGSSWSKHAYGCAIDVNWSTNGYGASTHDMPAWLVAIFKKWGFGWGGNWRRVKDWMHFSKFPNEGGDGILNPPGVEDDMAQVPQAEWEQMKKDVAALKTGVADVKKYLIIDPAGDPPAMEHLNRLDRMLAGLGKKLGLVFNPDGTVKSGG